MSRVRDEAAEAICAALHQTDFEFLGETEATDGGLVTWFTRGERPRNIRVSVRRHQIFDAVEVQVEWRVLGDTQLRACQKFTLPVGEATTNELAKPVEQIVVKTLEIFRDVVTGTGVAAPQETA